MDVVVEIPHKFSELKETLERLNACGQGQSASAKYASMLISDVEVGRARCLPE